MKNDYLNTLEESDMLIKENFEYDFEKQRMFFCIEAWFDVDKKFGVNTAELDGVWVNLYSTYNPCTQEIRILYTVDAEDGTFDREYIPTDEEKELFRKLMEQACEHRKNMTCREAYITEYIEDNIGNISLECVEENGMVAVKNINDNFILYAEEKGERLENHIGHSVELASYGNGECFSIECMDCNEVLYSTDAENLELVKEETLQGKEVSDDRWKYLLEKAVCYIGEYESGGNLYDSLRSEIGMSDEEIKEIGFTSLSEYFDREDEGNEITMT